MSMVLIQDRGDGFFEARIQSDVMVHITLMGTDFLPAPRVDVVQRHGYLASMAANLRAAEDGLRKAAELTDLSNRQIPWII